ncbi:uncharacterized protein Z518_09194 [Rhinocladiella mackenziei CBS 650.93]|uniref:Ribosome recycling factor domain-containing protein n=1 Tax=Rhinocladiella mackenziei CBS 650.93 TaxID=1442369 RepID=A0A0D2GSZ7_9EURO|nr:uncharacterized protein Z518_09194 [Rhinocladiella mackenziei CBS 650.93]KIX01468.1 hypothetical protein Z518_09194 [Rhinocladiella mackenziei CBS 650.93]
MPSRDAAVQFLYQTFSASRLQRTSRQSLFLCLQCRNLSLYPLTRTNHLKPQKPHLHAFSTTSPLGKKSSSSSKSSRKSPEVASPKDKETRIPDHAATHGKDKEIDPYDFTDLNAGIAKAIARLKDALVKTRDAGRITPEMIEALPVEINVKGHDAHGGPAHKEKLKIRDLASVVQKGGRMAQVFCAEEAHVKPITSAIQASPYSLVPQHDEHNPLCIIIPVPPATAETRAQARAEAKKVFDRASQELRNARGDAQKRHRKMELEKLVVADELRKSHKQMEDVVKKGQEECKRVYEQAVKSLDG